MSGGGKLIFVSLILRFYDVISGRLLIDGIDICDYEVRSFCNQVGMVFQDIFLFSEIIWENIVIGKFDVIFEEIMKVVKVVNVYEFIMSFFEGYEIWVGERGVKLLGG